MSRITKQVLNNKIETINTQLDTRDKYYKYCIDWSHGGIKLVRRDRLGIRIAQLHTTKLTKRELNNVLDVIISLNYIERG